MDFEERVRLALKNDAERLRTGFISQLIYGSSERKGDSSIEAVNAQFHFRFREGIFQILGIRFDRIGHDDNCISFLADRATDIIKQFLGSLCFDFELYVECSNLYVLLNYSTEDQKNIRRAVRQIFDELKQQEAILKGMEITAGWDG